MQVPISFDEVLKNDAFKSLEPEKVIALKEISEKIRGKSIPEAMNVLNSYKTVLNSGEPIPKEERELMITALLSSLDDEPREKFANAMKMIKMMKGS